MIYLDNAATTYPKPPSVINAVSRFMNDYGGNAGRGAHKLAMLAAECIYDCRVSVADLFGAKDPSGVVFTLNTTWTIRLCGRWQQRPTPLFIGARMQTIMGSVFG